MAARREGFVVERAGILEIADAAHAGFEFDELPIAQVGRRFAIANRQADARASVGREFEDELIAAFVKRRGRDHTAIQKDLFVGAGVDFGRRAGAVQDFKQRSAKEKGRDPANPAGPRGKPPGEKGEAARSRERPKEIASAKEVTREMTMPAARAKSGVTNGFLATACAWGEEIVSNRTKSSWPLAAERKMKPWPPIESSRLVLGVLSVISM